MPRYSALAKKAAAPRRISGSLAVQDLTVSITPFAGYNGLSEVDRKTVARTKAHRLFTTVAENAPEEYYDFLTEALVRNIANTASFPLKLRKSAEKLANELLNNINS